MDLSQLLFKLARIAVGLAFAWAIVSLVGCLSYRSLLFHRSSLTLEQIRAEAADRDIRLWPVDGPDYRGFVRATPPSAARGTIVVFHGNAGLAVHRSYYVDALEPLGYRVVLAEYPGYGTRAGSLSEAALIRDGLWTTELAREAFGGPLYLWGESLGCAIASGVAAQLKDRPAGLILLTPWDNLPDLAAKLYPVLPARLIVRERFDNAANLARYGGPAAFLIAEQDEIIPTAQSRRLVDSYAGPKKLWSFPDAGHNTWPAEPGLPWWREVMNFCSAPVTQNAGSTESPSPQAAEEKP